MVARKTKRVHKIGTSESLMKRTLDATDAKKSSECLKGAFESILFNISKIFSTQHESKRQAISNVTEISLSNLVID